MAPYWMSFDLGGGQILGVAKVFFFTNATKWEN
jgi:hypothetical protein